MTQKGISRLTVNYKGHLKVAIHTPNFQLKYSSVICGQYSCFEPPEFCVAWGTVILVFPNLEGQGLQGACQVFWGGGGGSGHVDGYSMGSQSSFSIQNLVYLLPTAIIIVMNNVKSFTMISVFIVVFVIFSQETLDNFCFLSHELKQVNPIAFLH